MATVRKLRGVRAVRVKHGLSIIQLAKVMGTNAANVEIWEAHPQIGPSLAEVRKRIKAYVNSGTGINLDNNVLFGVYPLHVARSLLQMRIEEIAKNNDYKKHSWEKLESNTRVAPESLLRKLEEEIRQKLKKLKII